MLEIQELKDNKLKILTALGLDIGSCETEEEVGEKIWEWLNQEGATAPGSDLPRMVIFRSNMINKFGQAVFQDGDALDSLLLDGWKGYKNFTKEEWLEELHWTIDNSDDLIETLSE